MRSGCPYLPPTLTTIMPFTNPSLNTHALSAGGFSLPRELVSSIFKLLFVSLISPFITPPALWQISLQSPSDVYFGLSSFYDLRLVCQLWLDIIDTNPLFWTFFPLPQMSPVSFPFLHSMSTRAIENGRRLGPDLIIFVSNASSLGFFLRMVAEGALDRTAILHLWMNRDDWMSARWLLDGVVYPSLTHGL